VIYSFATDIIWLPLIYLALQIDDLTKRVIATALAAALGFVATPVVLGWGWYKLQQRLAKSGLVVDQVAKPWDKMFATIRERNLIVGLILTLPDGRKLGGRYVNYGFASHYPADEQIHVGEAWEIDQATGAFIAPIVGSLGFIVDKRDILAIEFFEWSQVAPPPHP
jgi:hypothetical protein